MYVYMYVCMFTGMHIIYIYIPVVLTCIYMYVPGRLLIATTSHSLLSTTSLSCVLCACPCCTL